MDVMLKDSHKETEDMRADTLMSENDVHNINLEMPPAEDNNLNLSRSIVQGISEMVHGKPEVELVKYASV